MTLRNRIVAAIAAFPLGITAQELAAVICETISPGYLSRLASYGDVVVMRVEKARIGRCGRVHVYGPAAAPVALRYAPHVVRAREEQQS